MTTWWAPGVMHSVRDAARIAFECVGLDWEEHVVVDPGLVPAEVETLCADSSNARQELGWEPEVDFAELMRMMVESDLNQAQLVRDYGAMLSGARW